MEISVTNGSQGFTNFVQKERDCGCHESICGTEWHRNVFLTGPLKRNQEWKGFKRHGREKGQAFIWMAEKLKVWLIESEIIENVVLGVRVKRDCT